MTLGGGNSAFVEGQATTSTDFHQVTLRIIPPQQQDNLLVWWHPNPSQMTDCHHV